MADVKAAKLKTSKDESDYSEDSELDAIMLTIDTEHLASASQNLALKGTEDTAIGQYSTKNTEKAPKRKGVDSISRESQGHYSPDARPSNKKAKTAEDDLFSEDMPLFLHRPSLSSSSIRTPTDPTYNGGALFSEEDELALDDSLFEIVPSQSCDNLAKAHSRLDTNPSNLGITAERDSVKNNLEAQSRSDQREIEQLAAVCNDDWEDLVDWMENRMQ